MNYPYSAGLLKALHKNVCADNVCADPGKMSRIFKGKKARCKNHLLVNFTGGGANHKI